MPQKRKDEKKRTRRRLLWIPVTALLLCAAVALGARPDLLRKAQDGLQQLKNTVLPLSAPVQLQDMPASDEPGDQLLADDEDAAVMESVMPELVQASSPVVSPPAVSPAGSAIATSITGASGGYQSSGTVYFKNETKYTIDIASMLRQTCPVKLGTAGAQVLIMHTHGTESYTPTAANPYQATGDYRTTDKAHNMLRVGQEITDVLNQRGISTLHSETLNDYPAYNGAYDRSLKDIQAYVKQNPSIQIIIDVHRDAIGTGNSTYKTIANISGQQVAQMMLVTGTNAGGRSHDNWKKNLTFQSQLQDRLNSAYPGIMRPMSIRTGRFNQHVRTGSMLLEVGTCGNTLEEALAAARLFANTLADAMLKG